MTDQNQDKKLVGIARAFAKAAMNKQDDLKFEDRFITAAEENSWDPMELLGMVMTLASLKQKYGEDRDNNADYVTVLFQAANYFAEKYPLFCSDDEINALLPADAKSADVAAGFIAKGAAGMAKICTP